VHQYVFKADKIEIFKWLHHFTDLVPFSSKLLEQILVRLQWLGLFRLWLNFNLLRFREDIAAMLRTFQVRLRFLLGNLTRLWGFHSFNLAPRCFWLRLLFNRFFPFE